MQNIDFQLSNFFFEIGRSVPLWIVVFLATYSIWIIGACVLLVFRKRSNNFFKDLLLLFCATVLAYFLNFIVGHFFFRDRPFVSFGFDPLIGAPHTAKSFPSDHAAIAWTAACYIFIRYKKSACVFLVLALLVCLGRVLAGVHYIGDVASGAVIGSISSLLVIYLAKKRILF
ncbi:MAG: hypothetical protein CO042_04280 [Parcubacteria group bacterium CG_4_9_14_0_2_um_filter_41_8]|nr:MAG: hypothetical protein AUJ34_02675 [Parcubacteria group bacterium CG1_02_41_12]PIP67225.1 MAG: hypothetical protein COW93_01285 [Parcubacteria group bacterium CG22_combo_CG10-13_8_21_14_all_41_9]PIQ78912.1 MAG: hypothetical protein COV79_04750 [Parcubacteria group bacterium CG11_big_fil_rev_8_21_14_0_20_41_14]PIR56754.1 MAG: hypothetical protein COU72_04580 [Parcubacteria group bacterium CG10_big_fil_rev_8_21_14_0_10_41_35]PJC40341.1 MAG: hypothetical protein CO042_04280 [Parcubacteria gr